MIAGKARKQAVKMQRSRVYAARYMRERHDDLLARSICPKCGQRDIVEGKRKCSKCLAVNSATKKRSKINRNRGFKTPRLVEIDLSKSFEHSHPDIVEDRVYLARIDGQFHTGTFSHELYGWNFEGGPWQTGLQFDAPGWNSSSWEALWEIR
jgi:hypothetical protein